MSQANGVVASAFTVSAAGNSCDADAPAFTRETSQRGMDSPPASRRYSNRIELSQRQNGERALSANYRDLAVWGYSIIWASGEYCQAIRDERDVTFKWNGERWVEL
jgi:hypothetical protein